MKNNEKEKSKVTQYLDSIVITINPSINAAIPERYLYQKGSNEINYNLQDYIELVNK